MDSSSFVAKKTKLQNSSCLGSGKQTEVGFRYFPVCANFLKPIPEVWSVFHAV